MNGKSPNAPLKLKLTDEQRRDLIQYLAASGASKVEVSLDFDVDVKAQTLAPTTVLVGNAV